MDHKTLVERTARRLGITVEELRRRFGFLKEGAEMAAICVEVACNTDEELDEEISLKIEDFNRRRQKEKNCLPLTDYEKMLLAQFLRSLIS